MQPTYYLRYQVFLIGLLSGGDAMHLNGAISQRDLQTKILWGLKFVLGHLLKLVGLLIFWLFMVALLASPVWVPALVNSLLAH
jgi:hypothetical protein